MAEDLAIDIGLDIDSDEYASFVDTINNIVDLGCTYSDKVMKKIAEKCKTSELDIAKKVLNIIRVLPYFFQKCLNIIRDLPYCFEKYLNIRIGIQLYKIT